MKNTSLPKRRWYLHRAQNKTKIQPKAGRRAAQALRQLQKSWLQQGNTKPQLGMTKKQLGKS
jgi:hypothetical protein